MPSFFAFLKKFNFFPLQLVLQELNENSPRVTDDDDMIFFARRWYPSTRTLGDFHEILLPSKLKKSLKYLILKISLQLRGVLEFANQRVQIFKKFPDFL